MSPRGTASSTTLRTTLRTTAAAGVLLALLAGTAGCSSASNEGSGGLPSPATLTTTAKGAPPKVTLTADAVQRIGLQTAAVRHAKVVVAGRAGAAAVVPFSAVVYVADGSSWAYAAVAPNVYVRSRSGSPPSRGTPRCCPWRPPTAPRSSPSAPRSCSASKARSRGGMRPRPSAIRWIVGTSLGSATSSSRRAVAMMVFGVADAARPCASTSSPSSHRPGSSSRRPAWACRRPTSSSSSRCRWSRPSTACPGLDDLRSKSVPQLSSIELIFTPGTDLLQARQLVQERLATVAPSLPTWAAPPVMLPPLSATGRAMQIGMTSADHR